MRHVHPSRPSRRALAAAAVPLLVASFAAGCSKDDTTSTGAGATSTTTAKPGGVGTSTTAAGGGTTTTKKAVPVVPGAVTITDFTFEPGTQTAKVGDKITWTNEDDAPHQPKSDADGEQVIDSPALDQNKTYTVTFTKAGTFKYHCAIHNSMKGTITVS